jgi:hypothetical protein
MGRLERLLWVDCVEEPGGRRLTEVAPDPSWEDA